MIIAKSAAHYFILKISLIYFAVDDICIGQDDFVTFPDPMSTEGFYQCLNEKPVHGRCPDGRYYDTRYNICNLYSTATEPPETTEHDCPANESQETPLFLPSESDFGQYFLCYHGKQVALNCLKGLHWNQARTMCDYPVQCPAMGAIYLPHKTNCQFYFYCSEGVGVLRKCPPLYGWDIQERKCVIRTKANCFSEK